MWSLRCRHYTLGSLLLYTVVSQWSLMCELKTAGVVCPVCLSYQPMLRCLLTLTSIVLIQSFHSTQRLHGECGCKQGSRSLSHCVQQSVWTSGCRKSLTTYVRIFYNVFGPSIKGSAAVLDLKSVVGVCLLQSTLSSSLQQLRLDIMAPKF